MTLSEALTRATQQLEAYPDLHVDAARDAAYLLRHGLGISQSAMLADPGRVLTPDQQTAYDAMILRRVANEPIQYITGEQEFYGLALRVTRAVLIPRPETEVLVEAVLGELDSSQPIRILDVGTGSGAIAIALAYHLPSAQVTAVDLSGTALEVAASNAARHAVADRIRFIESDLLEGLANGEASFDAIVANPPYVPTAERASLHPQVREYEPEVALFAGAEGLDIYRKLIPQARAALLPNGLLALEIGHGQKEAVAELLSGWTDVRFVKDLQQIPRIALARNPTHAIKLHEWGTRNPAHTQERT
jgi:release factor glutamine methyltransferase